VLLRVAGRAGRNHVLGAVNAAPSQRDKVVHNDSALRLAPVTNTGRQDVSHLLRRHSTWDAKPSGAVVCMLRGVPKGATLTPKRCMSFLVLTVIGSTKHWIFVWHTTIVPFVVY
jgi:hypothetical protein